MIILNNELKIMWLNKLSSQYPNIILIGGSEGATMAHLVVTKRDDKKLLH